MKRILIDDGYGWWEFEMDGNQGAMAYFPLGYAGPYVQVQPHLDEYGVLQRPVIACQSGEVYEGREVRVKVSEEEK